MSMKTASNCEPWSELCVKWDMWVAAAKDVFYTATGGCTVKLSIRNFDHGLDWVSLIWFGRSKYRVFVEVLGRLFRSNVPSEPPESGLGTLMPQSRLGAPKLRAPNASFKTGAHRTVRAHTWGSEQKSIGLH